MTNCMLAAVGERPERPTSSNKMGAARVRKVIQYIYKYTCVSIPHTTNTFTAWGSILDTCFLKRFLVLFTFQ